MELHLRRVAEFPDATMGELLCSGRRVCFTKEDRPRAARDGLFVPSESAAPAGDYTVSIVRSARFGMELPFLRATGGRGFGLYVHPGHQHASVGRDTAGSVVLGLDATLSSIWRTGPAFRELLALLAIARSCGEAVELSITDPTKAKP